MPALEERRRAQRFPLDLPLQVKWGKEGEEMQKPAAVRDISASGVYFLLDQELRPESKVEFFVRLQVEDTPAAGVVLHCVGTVVRTEPKDPEQIGVAARIDRYRFLRPDDIADPGFAVETPN